MSRHSSTVGGSTAQRLISCPASLSMIRRLPIAAEVPSLYAEEGTCLHEAMRRLVADDLTPDDLVGAFCYDRHLSKDLIDSCLDPAHVALYALMEEHGPGADWTIHTEVEVAFPGIPGAFGTCDVIAVSDACTIVVDYKFGSGVPVYAIYPDDEGYEILNAQLMFYLTAAKHTRRDLFRGRRKIVIAIIQPRVAEPVTQATVRPSDITAFKRGMIETFVEAMRPQPRLAKGDHCRFAACKVICPAHVGPLIDLSRIQPVAATALAHAVKEPTPYGAYLGKGMDFIAQIEPLMREIQRQAHEFLDAGGIIPGYKAVMKRAYRKWLSEDFTADTMTQLGLTRDEIWEIALRSPAQMEKQLKARGIKALPEGLTEAVSSGTTIAREDDDRPAEQIGVMEAQLTHALRAIR